MVLKRTVWHRQSDKIDQDGKTFTENDARKYRFEKRKPRSELLGSSIMKNTESIDELAKPALDQRRRRLVRGAVAIAPVVLTLRSGALAAASCTGARTVSTTLDNNGRPLASVGAQQGDVCYKTTDVQVQVCPTSATQLENVLGAPATSATIGTNGKCGAFPGGTQVAILSSSSATSFAS